MIFAPLDKRGKGLLAIWDMKDLPERDQKVLTLLISEYINTALPVGSATIAKIGGMDLSPATIRNVLAGLEECGLLTHPHTSAGRIPTEAGLRYYVDTIIRRHELSYDEQDAIIKGFHGPHLSIEEVIRKAAGVLSAMSSYTGLVVMPRLKQATFKHMEFIPLSGMRVLGIFVSREGKVNNRIIDIDEEYSFTELEKISNYCNRAFYGLTLDEASQKASRELEEERVKYDRMMSPGLAWSKEIFNDTTDGELVVNGESRLFDAPEFTDVEKIKDIIKALEEKKKLVHLLNQASEGDDVSIFIGAESEYDAVANCSIVSSPYRKMNEVVGTIGVIGPTRMDYSKVIPIVDFTGRLVSDLLEK